MMGVERVFVDTDVLLSATDPGRAQHMAALHVFERWPAQGTALFVSGQVLREYLVVATRPIANNGLGLTPPEALGNVRTFLGCVHLLGEDARTCERLLEIVSEVKVSGKQMHDANIVATMATASIKALLTLNRADFVRFAGLCELVEMPS